MIERAGRAARPLFLVSAFACFGVRAARPCWTGRPAVPTGLKSARQLMAAVPIAREG